MSNPELFIVGVILTVVVVLAIAPLIWAAVLDGRAEETAALERAARLTAETRSGVS